MPALLMAGPHPGVKLQRGLGAEQTETEAAAELLRQTMPLSCALLI